MTSKWLDSAICLASFHYQSNQYQNLRPLTFGANPQIRNETRERERKHERCMEQTKAIVERSESKKGSLFRRLAGRKRKPASAALVVYAKAFKPNRRQSGEKKNSTTEHLRAGFAAGRSDANRLSRLTGLDAVSPSLFLQEAAHLHSLLSAVAMSTLRCSIEGAHTPLAEYKPGLPFPPVNPDE
jgi:hypothetical protein